MGAFARQAAKGSVESIKISYFGGIVDVDCVPLTRAVQKGWLSGVVGDEGVNDVNAPFKIKDLGIKVETVKSAESVDYNELIEVCTVSSDGDQRSVRGSLLGRGNDPRIVEVDGQAIEVRPVDTLLVVRNVDKPGIVGKLGTMLGDFSVNIANMSLSRADKGEWALTILELDDEPPANALEAIEKDPDIEEARVSRQG